VTFAAKHGALFRLLGDRGPRHYFAAYREILFGRINMVKIIDTVVIHAFANCALPTKTED